MNLHSSPSLGPISGPPSLDSTSQGLRSSFISFPLLSVCLVLHLDAVHTHSLNTVSPSSPSRGRHNLVAPRGPCRPRTHPPGLTLKLWSEASARCTHTKGGMQRLVTSFGQFGDRGIVQARSRMRAASGKFIQCVRMLAAGLRSSNCPRARAQQKVVEEVGLKRAGRAADLTRSRHVKFQWIRRVTRRAAEVRRRTFMLGRARKKARSRASAE